MKSAILIEPARPAERSEALRLAFQHLPKAEQPPRVATALELIDKDEMDPSGILVARRGDDLLGSIIAMTTPGAGGLVWPPQVITRLADRPAVEDELARFAAVWLRQRGAKLAQCMLSPPEVQLGAPLARNGFTHVTTLCYLRRGMGDSLPEAENTLIFQPYLSDPRRFGATLLKTYEDTRDCPELTGARELEEILDGHRAQGDYDPARWWLVKRGNEAVGVILLTRLPEWASWDVCYVGVVPAARRQGLGRLIMLKALAEAQRTGVAQVTLSVDDRNQPAWQLYRALGFEEFDRREVFLAVWGKTPR